jgi:nucleotide-binding universal stress UspA family protein
MIILKVNSTLEIPTGFKKLLVPVDGSQASMKAAGYGIHLAIIDGAEIILIYVIEDIKQGGAIGLQAKYGNVRIVEGFRKSREKAASEWMNTIKTSAEKKGVRLTNEVLADEGTSTAEIIVNYAKKNNIDLIVMGSRGLSKFKQLLFGSVANTVMTYSHCPVMVVR